MSGLVQRGAERTQVGIFSDFPTAGREPGKQATLPSTSQSPDQGGLFRRSQHRRNYLTDKPSPMPYEGKRPLQSPTFLFIAVPQNIIHIIPSMFSTLISMISHQEWQDSKICGALFFITEKHIRAEINGHGVFIPVSSPISVECCCPCHLFKFKNKYYISPISPAFSIKSNTLLKELLMERRSRSNCINQESAKI